MRRTTRAYLRKVVVLGLLCFGVLFAVHHWSVSGTSRRRTTARPGTVQDFAETLKVSVRVEKNLQLHVSGSSHVREVTLTNNGTSDFPSQDWEIFFTQIYIPLIGLVDHPEMKLSHVQGQVYMFSPRPGFKGIPPGGVYRFTYESNGNSLVYTDTFPNWYLTYKGSYPYVLESTRGDPAKFMEIQNTPQSWKASSDQSSYDFDHHNPPTSADRYTRDSVQDLGTDPIPVIPTPLEVEKFKKETAINMHRNSWVIVGDSSFLSEMEFLAHAWQLKISASEPYKYYIKLKKAKVSFSTNVAIHHEEAYSLEVSPAASTITITANKPAGAFNAVQSLIALRNTEGKIPSVVIHDAPRFKYRGLMLDVARNFHSKETIMRLIRLMAMYKLNKLHLHLTDDEGWRIEIPGLEELVSVGSRRCHDVAETECLLPFLGSGPRSHNVGTGYYTVSDYQEILAYAVRHHIEVIPEVDVPGHAHAAVVAMKQRYLKTGSSKYGYMDMKSNLIK
ncbi:beta-hexosaminidase-like [Plakobranchus ocellatus]|uniref:beta-N-acetylhexosaminidase n=1 Tax=Plakobranchus ocellatus TaxID=259542 RepID=A0AAV4B6Y8_9GAST|nr:beta-hexosaminidase-like [Plakobranchus ocellatus]